MAKVRDGQGLYGVKCFSLYEVLQQLVRSNTHVHKSGRTEVRASSFKSFIKCSHNGMGFYYNNREINCIFHKFLS